MCFCFFIGFVEIFVFVGGCDQDCDELVIVDCYNLQMGQWCYLVEFLDYLGGGYSIVVLGNDIYVIGGFDGFWFYDCVWRYNLSVNEWVEVVFMLKVCEYYSFFVLNGLLYVVVVDSIECYDYIIDFWEVLQFMIYFMDNCFIIVCCGWFYVIGFLVGKEIMVMQCYDLDIDLWLLVDCGQFLFWFFVFKIVILNGFMYFVRDDFVEVDVYNLMKNEWDKILFMNQVYVGGSLVVFGGKLYVFGGYDNMFEFLDVVEVYDLEICVWSVVGWFLEFIFWYGSVSIFCQFMFQIFLGGCGFELDSGSNDMDLG